MSNRSRFKIAALLASGLALAATLAARERRSLDSPDLLKSSFRTRPELHLLFNDHYHLVPERVRGPIADELGHIFDRMGISVTLHRSEEAADLRESGVFIVNANIFPIEPERWGLNPGAMAAAIGEARKQGNIYVFFPNVRRTLGQEPALPIPDMPGVTKSLGRAMGRILAHELVHVLAPEYGHRDEGLMARKLDRVGLEARDIEVTATTAEVTFAAACGWWRSGNRLAEVTLDGPGSPSETPSPLRPTMGLPKY